jgi:membrane-bound metal-dependent hydrolase YbcI (DUF457 family)
MYKTHKAFGALSMMCVFEVLRQKGLLLTDMAMPLQFGLMYATCDWGSTAPDLDHPINNVKEQTPLNLAVHKILHLTKPNHRSWQTHSVWLTGLLSAVMIFLAFHFGGVSVNGVVCRLLVTGLAVGLLSHLVADTFTVGGVYLLPGVKKKFRLVPCIKHNVKKTKKDGTVSVENEFVFGTGGKWESVFRVLVFVAIVGFSFYWLWQWKGEEVVNGIKLLMNKFAN